MTIKEAIEIGKKKIEPRNQNLGSNPERIYEILGFTNAIFFGWSKISRIRYFENLWQKHAYYQYVCHKLVKCSFKQALITPDFKKYKIFIFSFADEEFYGPHSGYDTIPRVVLIWR